MIGLEKFKLQNDSIRKEIFSLQTTNAWKSLFYILLYWFVIFASALVSILAAQALGDNKWSLVIYLVANIIISSRQRALENLIHEATHFNLSSNFKVNDVMAWFFLALPLGHNLNNERKMHVHGHHKYFWKPELDPDYERYKNMGLDQLPAESLSSLIRTIAKSFPQYVKDVIPAFFFPSNQKMFDIGIRLLYWSTILAGVHFLGISREFCLYWCIPFFITLTCIRFIAELSEHASLGCLNELFSSRNNLGWFNEHLIHPAGDGYHIVHHLFPKVPFYNLKKAHDLLLGDDDYRMKGSHCYSFLFGNKYSKSTLSDLIVKDLKESE